MSILPNDLIKDILGDMSLPEAYNFCQVAKFCYDLNIWYYYGITKYPELTNNLTGLNEQEKGYFIRTMGAIFNALDLYFDKYNYFTLDVHTSEDIIRYNISQLINSTYSVQESIRNDSGDYIPSLPKYYTQEEMIVLLSLIIFNADWFSLTDETGETALSSLFYYIYNDFPITINRNPLQELRKYIKELDISING